MAGNHEGSWDGEPRDLPPIQRLVELVSFWSVEKGFTGRLFAGHFHFADDRDHKVGKVNLELVGFEVIPQNLVFSLDGQDEFSQVLGDLETDLDFVLPFLSLVQLVSQPSVRLSDRTSVPLQS